MAARRRDVTQTRYLDAIRLGMTHEAASAYAGVSRITSWRWRREETFATLYMRAEDEAAARHEMAVIEAEDWRAHMAWLERRRKADWGKNEKLEVSGPEGGAIPVAFQQLDTETLRRLADGGSDPQS